MLKYTNTKEVRCHDWDRLVVKTYGRPYCVQQQNGCMDRGHINITIPSQDNDAEMHDSIPEEVNGDIMGVKFDNWLNRDPKDPVEGDTTDWMISLFWERNFYPDLQTIANDLHKRGLVEAGDYTINIDW